MPTASRKPRRLMRVLLIALAVIVVLPIVAIGLFVATFDADAYKPRIIEAVKRATGRDLVLAGPIHVKFALVPTLELNEVSFANIAGGSRPEMARLSQAVIRVALLPLISRRVEIDSLTLIRPDILLEADAQGHQNWHFDPSTPAQPLPQASGTPNTPAPPIGIAIRHVQIENGHVTWRDPTGTTTNGVLTRLSLDQPGTGAGAHLVIDGTVADKSVSLDAETGPLEAWRTPVAGQAWPLKLTATALDTRLDLDGQIVPADPRHGFSLQIGLRTPELARLTSLVPGLAAPPLRDVQAAAHVRETPDGHLMIEAITAHVGASDLAPVVQGGQLDALVVALPSLDAEGTVNLSGSLRGRPVSMQAKVTPTGAAGDPSRTRLAIDLQSAVGTSRFSVKGTLGALATFAGMDLAVSATVDDLGSLSDVAGTTLPALTNLHLDTRVAATEAASRGVLLRGLRLTMAQGDVSGDLAVGVAARPSLRGTLQSQRLDLDALMAALHTQAPPPSAQAPSGPPPAPRTRLFSETPLPFDTVKKVDGDIRLTVQSLIAGGSTIRDLSMRAVIDAGVLKLDPLTATTPEGRVELKATIDANPPAPSVALVAHVPALPLPLVASALGTPGAASGVVDVQADLRSAGRSPHALMAALDGHASASLVNGEVETRIVGARLIEMLQTARVQIDPNGRTALRCANIRLESSHGGATVALAADSPRLQVEGGGTLNLDAETLDLRLHGLARIGGTGFAVPFRVSGPFLHPGVQLDTLGAAAGLASGLANRGRFGAVFGALTGSPSQPSSGAGCAAQAAPSAAPSAEAPAATPAPAPGALPRPQDLLRRGGADLLRGLVR